MGNSTFERFAKRFALCNRNTESCHQLSLEVERIMDAAGQGLAYLVNNGKLKIDNMPDWVSHPPLMEVEYWDDVKNKSLQASIIHWATYWWFAVVWLANTRADSGIIMPFGRISRITLQKLAGCLLTIFSFIVNRMMQMKKPRYGRTFLGFRRKLVISYLT